MSKLVALLALSLAACATSGAGVGAIRVDPEPTPRARPHLALKAKGSPRWFPAALDPRLPSADLMARQVREEIGDVASADVRLCVTPAGKVQDVQLVRGTALAEFNRALVHDIADWQFSGSAGSTGANNCQVTTINYRINR
jgi:hypothetical protein